MPLEYQFVPDAPVLRESITSGSNSWITTNWSDTTDSVLTSGVYQNGQSRPLYNVMNTPTATATVEVLNDVQQVPLVNCEYSYSPHGSGSTLYGATWIMTALTLNMQVNGASNFTANFIAKSGSYSR